MSRLTRFSSINDVWSTLLVEELVRNDVTHFVISPGSRSAPLAIAAARNERVRSTVHFDERGAGYFALGVAKAIGAPIALICTSGTAAANYLPAIVEAAYARVPLIVLTADRPPELHEVGANQAIRQENLLSSQCRWHTTLPCPTEEIAPETLLGLVDQAVLWSLRQPAGPVHVNCMFREPLAPLSDERDFSGYLASVAHWGQSNRPYTRHDFGIHAPSPELVNQMRQRVSDCQSGFVIVGALRDSDDVDAVMQTARKLAWPIFPDITSGLRLGQVDPLIIPFYDQVLLSTAATKRLSPDVILHFGGAVTSKRLLQFIEQIAPKEYVHIDDHPMTYDPVHRVTSRVESDIRSFCNRLVDGVGQGVVSESSKTLGGWSSLANAVVDDWLAKNGSLGEPSVARSLSRLAPERSNLFIGNSMPIRDFDMYAAADGPRVSLFANRGASGIDGNVATAAGIAAGSKKLVTAVLGDVTLLHDLNSLHLVRESRTPIILVVLNNDGGGIFSFLPVASVEDAFERYFATPHGMRFEYAARMFDIDYAQPTSLTAFGDAYRNAVADNRSTLIEVVTSRDENVRTHRELQQRIAEQLDALASGA